MPLAAIQAYQNQLPKRLAELKLVYAEVVSIPHMENDDRNNALKGWERAAEIENNAVVAPPAALKLIGIGVIRHARKSG